MAQITTAKNTQTGVEYRAFDFAGIPLFSEKYYAKNEDNTCIICGRNTSKNLTKSGVTLGDGGCVIIHPEDIELAMDNGFMGWWAIGTECIKVIPQEFRHNLGMVR